MIRHTETTPKDISQMQLELIWTSIETAYEEEWRIDANGDVTLTVDEDMLIRILDDNPSISATLGALEEHNPENEKWEWVGVPEHLFGTYTIKGVYDASQRFLWRGERTYFFVQEGF